MKIHESMAPLKEKHKSIETTPEKDLVLANTRQRL